MLIPCDFEPILIPSDIDVDIAIMEQDRENVIPWDPMRC